MVDEKAVDPPIAVLKRMNEYEAKSDKGSGDYGID
jgi:hypothetical protein